METNPWYKNVFYLLVIMAFVIGYAKILPSLRDNGAGIKPTEERIYSATESVREARRGNRAAENGVRNAEKRADNIEKLVGESENIAQELRESIGRCEQIIENVRRREQK